MITIIIMIITIMTTTAIIRKATIVTHTILNVTLARRKITII